MSVSLVKMKCRVKGEWFQCNLGLKVKVSNFPCAVRGYFLLSQWFSTRGHLTMSEDVFGSHQKRCRMGGGAEGTTRI